MKKEYINILIADRDSQTAEKLLEILSHAGYRSQIVSNGNNLRDTTETAIRERTYDLVFLDVAIASDNGEDHAFAIMLQQISPETKIILMLNMIDQKLGKEYSRQGSFRYLLKPIQNKHEVIRLVETCLEPEISNNDLLSAYRSLCYLFRTNNDLNEIYDTVIKCASEVIGTNAVALWERSIDGSFVISASAGSQNIKVQNIKMPSVKGIVEQIIETRDSVLIKDVSHEKFVYPELIAHTQFKWLICVPIFFGNEIYGVIDVYTNRPYGFSEQAVDYLKALASQASVAIQNAKLIDHFNRIGQTITSLQDIKEILERIARSALEVLYAEPVILFQYDQTAKRLVPPPIYAGKLLEEKDYVETFEFSGYSFAELIAAGGKALYIEQNIDQHPLTIKAHKHISDKMPKIRFYEREKIKSLAALILRVEDEVVGLMFLNYRMPQRFSPIEKKIMETFAAHAAIAIKNSRLIEQLRSHEQYLKRVIEGTPDPIIVTENKTDKTGPNWRIEFANRVAHEMFGYDFGSRELEGKNARELFGDQLNRLRHALREAGGEISNFETSFLHKEGYPIPISLSTSILQKDASNRIVKTIGIAKDLTSIKEMEKQKITIDKLRLTLADVGHEFRSPLHIILSQLGGLKYHIDKNYGEDPLVKKITKIVEEEAFRAARQMKNTLFSMVESFEAMGIDFEKGNIGDTILLCADRFRETAAKRGIRIIVYDSAAKKLPPIYYDRTQMEQVFTNLLDNAVKYSHSNQNIEIKGKEVGRKVEISIIDRGLGIPEDHYERIFQGFTRSIFLDTSRYIPGTGLGLMIAKEIVVRHKGAIKVKSVPILKDPIRIKNYEGYETAFFILLPQNPMEV
ncbi:MAG: GAF domain-containing protein [candidate division KSB1 bacterium]|nr:GAF domain-containing protein [candidate division KSB1 bacterium]MDZ7366039.1 GAF domain-containing protein [candidate division KSB1 bacterium]MDZ7404156.1 GAF domain-containing protein [candidate division KSB1 bacterium]